MTIRSAYSPKKRAQIATVGPTATKQSFKNECDINHIMARYVKTGVIEHLNEHKPNYGFAPAVDFKTALDLVEKASTIFSELPSQIRAKFENNPENFLKFTENPDNRSELALMGLLSPEATQEEADKLKASDSASAPLPPNPATTDAE